MQWAGCMHVWRDILRDGEAAFADNQVQRRLNFGLKHPVARDLCQPLQEAFDIQYAALLRPPPAPKAGAPRDELDDVTPPPEFKSFAASVAAQAAGGGTGSGASGGAGGGGGGGGAAEPQDRGSRAQAIIDRL
eukprot:360531-Chlamydomonas_euryale.AAC.1